MISTPRTADWDIFCQVIDNYGDIGVCWRLARQLSSEHGFAVRLWVDELDAFACICPQADASVDCQAVEGVEVRRWVGDFEAVVPRAIVIESFACQLPERFLAAMALREPRPVWINLEYLSAEAWTLGCHALPSPHPRLPLTKYFFFPGFSEKSGGLLREAGLMTRRLEAQGAEQFATPPPEAALLVSLFAYETAAIGQLLSVWEKSGSRICCLAPVTKTLAQIEAYAGRTLLAGDVVRRGELEIRILPFVSQDDYDRLLWSCDLNFVRGEDSFVRAQWAGRPLLWNIYPQAEDAHLVKLAAFLDLYCAGLEATVAAAVRSLHHAWNADASLLSPQSWAKWIAALPKLREHSSKWAIRLSKQEDLCSQLVRFCRSKL